MSKDAAIVIPEDERTILELKKKWRHKKRLGERMMKIGTSSFIITLLSPFDFEGPIAEIATAVIAGAGYFIKQKAEIELEDLEDEEQMVTKAK